MLKLRPGDVVYVNKGKYRGPAAVVAERRTARAVCG